MPDLGEGSDIDTDSGEDAGPEQKSETDESEIQDELPNVLHADDQEPPDDAHNNLPDPDIGWRDEYQRSFYARLGERLHGICARHTISDRCGAEIWGLMKSLFEKEDAAKMKCFKAVKNRNLSVLPKLFVDTHYMDKEGKKHVMKNLPKYPRKFIESKQMTLMTVVTRFRLPDVLRVIELIHTNMEEHGNEVDTDDEDDDDWALPQGRKTIRLARYQTASAAPGEASCVDMPDGSADQQGKHMNIMFRSQDRLTSVTSFNAIQKYQNSLIVTRSCWKCHKTFN